VPNFSPDRQTILDLLASMDRSMSPSEISALLAMEVEHVRKKLSLMKKVGHVRTTGWELYQPVVEKDAQEVGQDAFDFNE
jgi:DNA-binding IclR family transcriptional regulator